MSSRRRRLRITSYSSDEEDDVTQPPHHHPTNIEPETLNLETVTLNPSNPNPNHEISDEDFIDAFDNLPQPTATSSEHSRTSSVGTSSDNPVGKVLEELGLRLRGDWLDSCLSGLESGVTGFNSLDVTKKAKMCFERFLESDMNVCGAGLLPSDVGRMHLVDLPGPFVLQVDEIVNISQPLRQRYKKANAGFHRCLKLSMTDGVQRVFGMEYQPIKDLDALAPAGLKVAISNVNVRHGLIMLVPEVFQVLGGSVEELDAARQRLVTEVNKPPRGRRTRSGDVPPLAARATRAAWPAEDINIPRPLNNPVPQRATPIQVDDQGVRGARPTDGIHVSQPLNNPVPQRATPVQVADQGVRAARPTDGIHVSQPLNNPVPQRATPVQVADQGVRAARSTGGIHVSRPLNNDQQRETSIQVDGPTRAAWPTDENHVSRHLNNNPQRGTPIHVDGQGTHATWPTDDIHVSPPSNNCQQRANVIEVDSPGTPATRVTDNIHVSRPVNNPVPHTATPMQVDDQGTTSASVNERVSSRTEVESSFSTRRENIEPLPSMATTESSVYMETEDASFDVSIPSESAKTTPLRVTKEADILIQRPSPVAISDDEDVCMVAAGDNHFASGRSNESPFMYLATLFAKWAETKDQVANVEGKVKCFVTGVKRFQYKERSTYKLHVFVDDGSLISEILIDHSFVQKKIGYSPEEVIAAFDSSDPSRDAAMKSRMKEFQVFLANFEGIMVLRINEASDLPTALDLQQGCPPADAWSLLTRLKLSNAVRRPQLDPIDLSP